MAATKIKGLTVEIGGDTTKLGKALDSVNKKGNDLSAELREINKMLKFDPGNADLLAQKQKVLAEAVANTSEKLKTLKEAEKQVQKQFERGEVSEDQVRALQREIMSTESKLGSYEKAAKETAEAVEKLGDEAKDAATDTMNIENATDKAGKELDDFADSAEKAEKSSGKLGSTLGGALKTGLVAVATGAAAAVSGMGAATVSAADYADEMLTMSSVTGVSTDNLQAFRYAAELIDVDLDTFTKSMAKNVKSMSGAANGSKAYADAYAKLGVSVTDSNGHLRDGETVYWESIDALGKMTNETERDAIAMQLFGKSAQELNPLIEAGAGKMKELTQEARDVGAVMSEDTLDALGSFDDSMQRLKGSTGAAKNSLGAVLLPELQHVTDEGTGLLNKFTLDLNASGGGLDGFVSTLEGMAPEIASKLSGLLTSLLDKVASLAPAVVKVGMGLVTNLTTSLISMLPDLVQTGITLILSILDGLTQAIPQITQAMVDMIPRLVDALVTGIPQLIDGAVKFLLAIVDAIPLILPPLIDAIPRIVFAIIDGLLDAIPQLIQGALQFLLAIVDAIPQLVAVLVPAIPEIVTTIVLGLLDNIPLLLDAAVQLLLAIVEAIPQICAELVKALPQIWETMKSFLGQLPSKIWAILKSIISNFTKFGTESRNTLKDAMRKVVSTVVDTVKELPGKMLEAGRNLVKGLWDGISGAYEWLKEKIKGWVGNVTDFLRDLFGINSPSKVTAYMGEMLDEGFAKGIEDNTDSPLRAMDKLSQGMLDEADSLNGLTLSRQVNHTFGAVAAPIDNSVLAKLDQLLAAVERGKNIFLNGDAWVGATANQYDQTLGRRRALAERGAL